MKDTKKDVIESPQWLKDRLLKIQNFPSPTPVEVQKQFDSSKKQIESVNSTLEILYVVFRDDNRVSDLNHSTIEDAEKEADHWNRILQRWPDGSKIVIKSLSKENKSK